ncbi:hypothetical protein L2K20_09940 [Mycobacterium sp. MBM]|nr:hypothetical protein [Mycobacterium sp. MBM]
MIETNVLDPRDDPDAAIYAEPLDRHVGIEYLPDAPGPEDGPDDYVGPRAHCNILHINPTRPVVQHAVDI